MTKNLERKKKEKYTEQQIGEGPFSILRHNLSLLTCKPNFKFLSLMVVKISLTKNLERKKKGTNTRKDKWETAHFQPHDTCILNLKFLS